MGWAALTLRICANQPAHFFNSILVRNGLRHTTITRLGRLHLNSAGLCAIRMKALIDYWQIDELLLGEWRHTAGTGEL